MMVREIGGAQTTKTKIIISGFPTHISNTKVRTKIIAEIPRILELEQDRNITMPTVENKIAIILVGLHPGGLSFARALTITIKMMKITPKVLIFKPARKMMVMMISRIC